MIDAHCHVDLYSNPIKIANECEQLGITVIAMTNLPSHFEMGYKHLRNFRKVRLALGMHPLYAEEHKRELALFTRHLSNTSYIGEIGLDFSREGIGTKDLQTETFISILSQLGDKPKFISLHSRKAEKEVLKYLLEFKIRQAAFHWYSGPVSLITTIAEAGYYFSINLAMIKSKSGQQVIKQIPKENILTESDGPFIEHQGRTAKPNDIGLVLSYLSGLWGVSAQEVENVIDGNFRRVVQELPG